MPEITQEEMERAQAALEREEKRRERERAYRENRKGDPEVQAKQKAYNQNRQAKEKIKRQALNMLAENHPEEFQQIQDSLNHAQLKASANVLVTGAKGQILALVANILRVVVI